MLSKFKRLLFLFLVLASFATFAGAGGGNGQLVVIPAGQKKPVPYEVAKSWDSGVYRNFNKLPGMPGVTESREKFDRPYAVYAQQWLELIKTYNTRLYNDLKAAANGTRFRYLNNYILWKHEEYPQGEIDYKTYEKAAFYNGEIIVSTIVMDRLGGIDNVISKEENQGFVVIHELINAAYPRWDIKRKLLLGELIANIKLLKWTKVQFLSELVFNNFAGLYMQVESYEDYIDVVREIGDQGLREYHLGFNKDQMIDMLSILAAEKTSKDGVLKLIKKYGFANVLFTYIQDLKYAGVRIDTDDIYTMDFLESVDDMFENKVVWWKGSPWISGFDDKIRNFLIEKRREGVNHALEYYQRKFLNDDYANYSKEGLQDFILMGRGYGQIFEENLYDIILKGDYGYYFNGVKAYDYFNTDSVSRLKIRNMLMAEMSDLKNKMGFIDIYKGVRLDTYRDPNRTVNVNSNVNTSYEYETDTSSAFNKMSRTFDVLELFLHVGTKLSVAQPETASCRPSRLGIAINETMLVSKNNEDVIVLKVIESNDPERVGKKIKVYQESFNAIEKCLVVKKK